MTTTTDTEWVGLPEAAERLQLHRATINAMVRDGRIQAQRVDAHWFISREDLDKFAATYRRPRNTPPRARRQETLSPTSSHVIRLLLEWDKATVDEIQKITGVHPGNVRKNLRLLEAHKLAERTCDGSWRATSRARNTLSIPNSD
jgi:excisionase family DNA binding protein